MKLPQFFKPSPKTILLQWESIISEETQQTIQYTEEILLHHFSEVILETTPTYNELAIYLKGEITMAAFQEKLVEVFQKEKSIQNKASAKLITIPVCYETEFASDLSEVMKYHNISKREVIQLHTQPVYQVSFIGFLPGFPYLTGLSEKLMTPRKTTPRANVVQGSVGIGGKQTGIYPSNSPGGWNIIGRSPIPIFSIEKEQPSLCKAGDSLKFQFISKAKFDYITLEVASGVYQLKIQEL